MSEMGETVDDGEGAADIASERRTRKRNSIPEKDHADIVKQVLNEYETELANRGPERERRLQRYAKYRLWTEVSDWPWPDAANSAIPDMLQDSLRIQDTLHNAVMSQKPPVLAKGLGEEDDKKAKMVDDLQQYQVFTEQKGEVRIGEIIEGFTNDPAVTVYIPWVRDKRKIAETKVFDPVPDDQSCRAYFLSLLKQEFQGAKFDQTEGGWDATVTQEGKPEVKVSFYTNEDDEVEMVTMAEVTIFDGPCIMVKDYDDVLFPTRSGNLQPPGPSNPTGAPWVILRDFPGLGEIKNLQAKGYYDSLSDEDVEALGTGQPALSSESQSAEQKDNLAGTQQQPGRPKQESQMMLTRLIRFGAYDFDGNGNEEQAVFWVLKEAKKLLRVRRLSDVNPGAPPARPFAGGSFLPVSGRYSGMSLLEIMESTHDVVKVLLDQAVNAQDLAIGSPGWYRPSGGMNPEVLKIEPFTLNPLQNPQQDVVFPQIGNSNAMASGFNLMNMLGSWQDKITMVSDLSFGQVPSGSSSALRTIGGMSLAMGQGEARPERILRRFFTILTEMYAQIHRLNCAFLSKEKKFRVMGIPVSADQDPYRTIDGPDEIKGVFNFTFDANAFNTSKMALQASLEKLMRVIINPLTLQMGIADAEGVYTLICDYAAAQGQVAQRYLKAPSPEADQPRIMAEEAIREIMMNQLPLGRPLESGGAQDHMQKLLAFMEGPEFGLLHGHQVDLFRQYLLEVRKRVAAEQAKAQQLQAAGQFAQNMQQKGPGAPPQAPPQAAPNQPPPISGPAELTDETLPGAGGGANNGV